MIVRFSDGLESALLRWIRDDLQNAVMSQRERAAACDETAVQMIRVGGEGSMRLAHALTLAQRVGRSYAESVAHRQPQRGFPDAIGRLRGQHREMVGAVRCGQRRQQRASECACLRVELFEQPFLDLLSGHRLKLLVLEE